MGIKNKWVDAQTFMISSPTVTNQVPGMAMVLQDRRFESFQSVLLGRWEGGLLDAKARIAVVCATFRDSWR